MTGATYLALARPRVIAHRGLALTVPENTLASFQAATDAGAHYLETDVHVSRDGVAVVSHDPDLARFGHSVRIADRTVAELGQTDLGGGHCVPTLAEVLDAFPASRFNIDLKEPAVLGPALAAIQATGASERVLVTSFSDRRRRQAARELPGIATSAGTRAVLSARATAFIPAAPGWRSILGGAAALQVPERYFGLHLVTPAMLRAAHRAGVELHVWTINEPDDMRRLLALGVDGIVTDRADLALAVVAEVGVSGTRPSS